MSPWPETGRTGVPTILITSGASCPDASIDRVMKEVIGQYANTRIVDEVLKEFEQRLELNQSSSEG